MELVQKVLSKPKVTRTDLSNVYKQIKQLKLNIPWLDLYRKSTRLESLNKLKNKLQPKKTKFIVSGTIIKTEITIFKNGFQKQNTYQENYNETFNAFGKKDAIKQARDDIAEKNVVGADYSGIRKVVEYKAKRLRATPFSKFKDVPEMKTKMRNIIRSDYDFFSEDKQYLKNTGYCVLDNIIGRYEGRAKIKKKLNREWFVSKCNEVAEHGWQVEDGVTPEMIQHTMELLDISVYAFDVTKKCFSKYVCKHRDHPALVYYCINDHMYMISDHKQVQNLIKGSVADDTKINSSVFKESRKKKATENIYKLPLYENVSVEELSEYSDCVIIYTKSNINPEVEAIIKQYNTIPSEI